MPKEYTQEQLWKLYENLPERSKELIFSEKAANIIWDVSQENKIPLNDVSKISKNAGKVILGVLPLDKFQETIRSELKIQKIVAEKISRKIEQLIFSQIRESSVPAAPQETTKKGEKIIVAPEKEIKKPARKDTYREPVE